MPLSRRDLLNVLVATVLAASGLRVVAPSEAYADSGSGGGEGGGGDGGGDGGSGEGGSGEGGSGEGGSGEGSGSGGSGSGGSGSGGSGSGGSGSGGSGSGSGSGSGGSGSGGSGSGSSGDDSSHDDSNDDGDHSKSNQRSTSRTRADQDTARAARSRGDAAALRDIIGVVQRSYGGEVVDVGLTGSGKRLTYRLKVIDRSGRLLMVSVNAATKAIVGVKGL